jgi:excisionase family DNA binding protein
LLKFQPIVIAALKILHYPVVVCPNLAITMSTSTGEGEILTIKQVAGYLKVTERTIYRLAAAKKIPAFKVGGTWRFSRADIDSWIKQQSMDALDTGREEENTAKSQLNDGERK